MRANIKRNQLRRVVIVGGGIGGLQLAMALRKTDFQVVLIDKNNYNQFPPLIYQVASSGLEPSNISFPFRRIFQNYKNFFFRKGEVKTVDTKEKMVTTTFGNVHYDYLVLAAGAQTNFFGNKNVEHNALPMKTVTDAMKLRNTLLSNLEQAETEDRDEERKAWMNIVIVGGGPSGVEIAGALADMKRTVLRHDYPDLDPKLFNIHLINSRDCLLASMDTASSERAEKDLRLMGVDLMLGQRVVDYKDNKVALEDGTVIPARTVIWVSGIRGVAIGGIPEESIGRGGRILVDRFNEVKGMENVYAIGDLSLVDDGDNHQGHPQLAQVAIQQAKNLAHNLINRERGKGQKPFVYRNLGTMATIGRKKAVAEIGGLKFGGLAAWLLWLLVHLRSILGVRNKTMALINWTWNYFNYKQSLRLILDR